MHTVEIKRALFDALETFLGEEQERYFQIDVCGKEEPVKLYPHARYSELHRQAILIRVRMIDLTIFPNGVFLHHANEITNQHSPTVVNVSVNACIDGLVKHFLPEGISHESPMC